MGVFGCYCLGDVFVLNMSLLLVLSPVYLICFRSCKETCKKLSFFQFTLACHFLSLSLTHTHTLRHTHTHTHTFSNTFSLFLSKSHKHHQIIQYINFFSWSHTRTHSLSLSLSHTHFSSSTPPTVLNPFSLPYIFYQPLR